MGERARQARKLRAAGSQTTSIEESPTTRAIATYATNEQPRKVNTNCKHPAVTGSVAKVPSIYLSIYLPGDRKSVV